MARFVCCRKNYGAPVEKLCWSCLSPTLNLFHPPCPLRLKLLGSSMALLPGKLLMLPFSGRRWLRLLRLFWPAFFPFSFLFCFVSSQPVTFLFFRFLPISSLLCTTWNFSKFHTFLSVFLSPHSDCPLIRSDPIRQVRKVASFSIQSHFRGGQDIFA